MTRSEAQKLIADIVKLREAATDAQASLAVSVYPTLKQDGSLIKSGTRINYNGTIIRVAVDLYDTDWRRTRWRVTKITERYCEISH